LRVCEKLGNRAMDTIKEMGIVVVVVCVGLAGPISADETQAPAAITEAPPHNHDLHGRTPAEVEMPIHMDEPMQTEMMKKGMMKGDVKKSAEKHAEKMHKELEMEEESMPTIPAQEQ
jgi:hypothetical protein